MIEICRAECFTLGMPVREHASQDPGADVRRRFERQSETSGDVTPMDKQLDAAHPGGPLRVGHPEGVEPAVCRLGRSHYSGQDATTCLKQLQNLRVGGVHQGAREEAHVVRGSPAGELHRIGLQTMRGMLGRKTAIPLEPARRHLPVPTNPRPERSNHAVNRPIHIIRRPQEGPPSIGAPMSLSTPLRRGTTLVLPPTKTGSCVSRWVVGSGRASPCSGFGGWSGLRRSWTTRLCPGGPVGGGAGSPGGRRPARSRRSPCAGRGR
jgi:hypothetical protein